MPGSLKGIERFFEGGGDGQALPVKLSALFSSYGYKKYRMSRFEEYSLYAQNFDFLAGSNVITFGGADGKLLALRPDVTLSIAKNTKASLERGEKLYYHESVYRQAHGNLGYEEIDQMGVEHIGRVDLLTIAEQVELILRSLRLLSNDYALDISHSGLVHGMVSELKLDQRAKAEVYDCIKKKSVHAFSELMKKEGVSDVSAAKVRRLIELSGPIDEALAELGTLISGEEAAEAYVQLTALSHEVGRMGEGGRLRLDFSVFNHLDYYNGVIFNGFIKEYPKAVIVGGQYDKLLQKLGKNAQALGFAVNLGAAPSGHKRALDAAIVYDESDGVFEVLDAAQKLREKGKSVYVGTTPPQESALKTYVFREGELEEKK